MHRDARFADSGLPATSPSIQVDEPPGALGAVAKAHVADTNPYTGSRRWRKAFGAVAKVRFADTDNLHAKAKKIRAEDDLVAGSFGTVYYKPVTVCDVPLKLEPLHPSIGTIVHDIDLAKDLDDPEMVRFLHNLWLERRVIMFRDQNHLTREQLVNFAAHFGEVGAPYGERQHMPNSPEPLVDVQIKVNGHLTMLMQASDEAVPGLASFWHADATWQVRPPMASVLMCREAPPVGGDTSFCDCYAMWEGLPLDVRNRVEHLTAVHVGKVGHQMDGVTPSAIHPVARTHPETGRTTLYVQQGFVRRLAPEHNIPEDEERELLLRMRMQAGRPDYTCRFRWETGSIAIWDNRAALHSPSGDFWPHRRVMERLTILDRDESRRTPYYAPKGGAAARGSAPTRGKERQSVPQYKKPQYKKLTQMLLRSGGLLERTEAALRHTVEANTNDAAALLRLGDIQRGEGKLSMALDCYRRVVSLRPDDAKASWLVAVLSGQKLPDAPVPARPVPFVYRNGFLPQPRCKALLALAQANHERFKPGLLGPRGTVDRAFRQALVERAVTVGEVRPWFETHLRNAFSEALPRMGMCEPAQYWVEMAMSAHLGGGFYAQHNDNGGRGYHARMINFAYYFHREPRRFSGGELLLHDSDSDARMFTRIEPRHNSIVFFPSSCTHQITPIENDLNDFGDACFAIHGWLRTDG